VQSAFRYALYSDTKKLFQKYPLIKSRTGKQSRNLRLRLNSIPALNRVIICRVLKVHIIRDKSALHSERMTEQAEIRYTVSRLSKICVTDKPQANALHSPKEIYFFRFGEAGSRKYFRDNSPENQMQ
jgi:hypothetical protein